MNRKNVSIIGIITCIVYFIVTFNVIMSSGKNWISLMELVTMFSGILMVMIVLILPFSKNEKIKTYKLMAIIFVSACMILTNMAHMLSLTVIEPLITNGVNIPDYFQIGKIPSIQMGIDYLAWGLFMGLSFIFSAFGIESEFKTTKIKHTLFICGCLCIVGFFASMINENLWYIAPIGYGPGTVILCIELLFFDKKVKNT